MNIDDTLQMPTQAITSQRSEAGFSLVELMIATLIGLVVLAAVGQIFIGSRATHQLDEGLARVQEGARFSMDFLAKEIRMAGYMGCNSALFSTPGAVNNIVKPSNQATTFSTGGIRGYRYACTASCTGGLAEWDPALPGDYFAAGDVQIGSDVIIINRGSDLGTTLTGNLVNPQGEIKIVDTAAIGTQIADDDVLLISDCSNADIFRVTNINNPGGSGKFTITHAAATNTTPSLSKAYQEDARLMKLVSRAYYVARNANNEPGLYLRELGAVGGGLGARQELVGSVESMKILYGVDTAATGSPERYVPPSGVTDWTRVVSVRLGLLLRTPGVVDTETDTKTYHLLGDETSALDNFGPPNDTRRRRVFNTTIRVRNH